MAVATYIVATEPLGEARARELIANNAALSDMNWVLDYFRRSADHRLLFGGRVNYSGLRSFDAPAATRARMRIDSDKHKRRGNRGNGYQKAMACHVVPPAVQGPESMYAAADL